MPFPFYSSRRVEFCHTDAAGIMHFSVFFQFMEQVEHEMLREWAECLHGSRRKDN